MNEERIRKYLRQVERICGYSSSPSHNGDRKAMHKALQKPDTSLMHNIGVSTKLYFKILKDKQFHISIHNCKIQNSATIVTFHLH